MKKNIIFRFGVFIALLGFLSYRCYQIFGYYDNIHSAAVFKQFYNMPKNSVDVVWLGPSSTQEFVIPTVMFEETGLALFSLSVGNEPFMATKGLIKESEKVQNPKLYMVDIRHLAYIVDDDTYIRRITDNMRWSSNRVEMIHYMIGNLEQYHEGVTDSKIDYYLPLTKYHTRWGELQKEDFDVDDNVFLGYFIKAHYQEFEDEVIKARFNAEPRPISEENEKYLDDFLEFCDSLDKTVIFTRTPNCLEEEQFGQYNYIQRKIEARGYEVWDLNREVDGMGINYARDFADPMHTNVYGAQKLSRYVAKELMKRFDLEDHRGDPRYHVYQEMSELFHEKLSEIELRETTDFNTYLDRLLDLDKEEYSIYIAERDIQGWELTSEMTEKLKLLGFDQADILLEHVYHSFIGIIANNKVVYQQIGQDNEPSHYEGSINGQDVSIDSMTWQGGNLASIKLGNQEYAKNVRGLNFVVVDNKDGMILDSVAFDTHTPEMICVR